MMKRFESDYLEGAHPDVLRALIETNGEQTPGYGEDPHCEAARALLRERCELPEGVVAPMLLCQRAEKLDLYDTVDAAVCSLDGVNYMRPETLPEVFRRLHLFLSPGGTLCFDFLSPGHMRSLDGQCFVDEEDDTLCLWRSEVVENELRYGMDIFRRIKGQTYRREQEEHTEYIYTPETLEKHLVDAGFGSIRLFTDGPQHNQGRLFFTAECVKE